MSSWDGPRICIGDLFPPIYRDVSVVDNSKYIYPPYTLVVGAIDSFAYALTQSAKLVGVLFIPLFYA